VLRNRWFHNSKTSLRNILFHNSKTVLRNILFRNSIINTIMSYGTPYSATMSHPKKIYCRTPCSVTQSDPTPTYLAWRCATTALSCHRTFSHPPLLTTPTTVERHQSRITPHHHLHPWHFCTTPPPPFHYSITSKTSRLNQSLHKG